MYDCIIRNGTIVDGSGAAPFRADVAIYDGKISAIGDVHGAEMEIDASGKVVTPGFIDIHRHADFAAFRGGFGELELRQGLTTIVNGNCGLSVAPVDGPYRKDVQDYLHPITGPVPGDVPTGSMGRYLEAVDRRQPPIHSMMLVGAGTVRAAVAGYDAERLSSGQVAEIQRILCEALDEGALGISLGLGYAPECFYTTAELTEVLRPFGGRAVPVTVHMREEGDAVLEALEEMLGIARELDLALHISHLKAIGRRNWNAKVPKALEMMEKTRGEGIQVDCDAYPYTAGSTQLIHVLPPDFLVGGMEGVARRLKDPEQRRILTRRIQEGNDFDNIAGMIGWENILCSTLERPENQPYIGKSIAEIAAVQGRSPFDAAYDLLVSERCGITMIDFINAEEDIQRILLDDHAAVISDSTYPVGGTPHPRLYGTFARIIERYVCEKGLLPIEKAVNKMTGLPARALRLRGKGLIREGCDADICVFDPALVHECGTYEKPRQFAAGMEHVLVGGVAAISEAEFVGTLGQGRLRD